MAIQRRTILLTGGTTILLCLVALILWSVTNSRYRSRIPEVPNLESLSDPVQKQIIEAVGLAGKNPTADNLGKLGMVYHSSANYEQAGICYRMAIGRERSEWIWNYYYGYLNMELGDPEVVIENFRKVIEKNPEVEMAWYYMGEQYRNMRNNAKAEEAFGKIAAPGKGVSQDWNATRVDHFPLSVYARYHLARIYSETSRTEMAEKTLREILQANRTFGPAYRLLGSILYELGDTLEGDHYTVRANDLLVYVAPVDTLVDRLILLSRSEFYLPKKIDEAERSFYDQWTLRLVDQAMKYMPDNKYVISKAIKTYLWRGLLERADSLTDRHIGYFRDDYNELTKTGIVFFVNRLYPEAEKYLTSALKLKPEEISIREELSTCYWSLGRKEQAYDMLHELLRNHPDDPDVLADVADIFFYSFGNTIEATKVTERITSLSPNHPKGMKVSAGIAEKTGKNREAIRLYEASFHGNPEELTTIRYLGNLLVKEQMWQKAILLFREALEYHPNEPDLLEKLGSLLTLCPDPSLRHPGEGIEYLERAFIHQLSSPGTLLSAGRSLSITLAQNGKARSALRTIEQTLEIARQENISPAYLSELEQIYRTIQALNN